MERRPVAGGAVAAVAALAVMLAAAPAAAQFWAKKDFREWTAEECEKLLSDSPWARQRTVTQVVLLPLGPPGDFPVPGRESTPQVVYTVRFLSAQPIRQAMVRFSELARGSREAPLGEDQARQQRAERFIQQTYPEHIVVQLLFTTNARAYDQALLNHWQTRAKEELKQVVLLYSSGPIATPSDIVVVPGGHGEIHLIFPREINGRPVAKLDDRNLRIEFPHPRIGVLPADRIFCEFRVREMLLDGKLVL